MSDSNLPKEFLTDQLDQGGLVSENSSPELQQDLTPAAERVDLAQKTRLETEIHQAQKEKEEQEKAYWRAKIAHFQELAHKPGATEALKATFSGQTQIDIAQLQGEANAHKGSFYGETLRKKLKAALHQQQKIARNNGATGLSEAGKVLRYGASTGEDDSSQKAA